MARRPISAKTAEHYKWGGDLGTDCDGWHLVRTPDLSIIEELMPPRTRERRHYHLHARQFFYVLDGVLSLEVDGQTFDLQAGEGIEVSPRQPHQAFNQSLACVRFLVTSQPPSHGDRVNA
ncbi:cupin domain-containing protein [Tunturiibacter lichenicola]|uniref:cupin domain-containing protein n=1 Tax=Tunturiibacter lichenicola TaxID=2051959 RepID=UPI0021B42E12|nr:cupin domain-containing protein [Edaphobacter lichenicola]